MSATSIEWTDATWNFISAYLRANGKRGWFCTKRNKDCAHCYAEAINIRLGNGLQYIPANLPLVEFRAEPQLVRMPLVWRNRKRVFVNSMTDYFLPGIPDWMKRIGLAVMHLAWRHDFQILTKQPKAMERFFRENTPADCFKEALDRAADHPLLGLLIRASQDELSLPKAWPLPNVHLGITAGHQDALNRFVPYLLRTPATVRFISVEPMVENMQFREQLLGFGVKDPGKCQCGHGHGFGRCPNYGGVAKECHECDCNDFRRAAGSGIHWVIFGGESGPGARPCNVEWIRSGIKQCRDAGVSVFVKQLGAHCITDNANMEDWPNDTRLIGRGDGAAAARVKFKHPKGGDITEWPEEFCVRELPVFTTETRSARRNKC